MNKYSLKFSKKAIKDLKRMDKTISKMLLLNATSTLDGIDNPRRFGKALTGNWKGFWRYRFGNYRLICDIEDDELVVVAVAIGHRKNIYK